MRIGAILVTGVSLEIVLWETLLRAISAMISSFWASLGSASSGIIGYAPLMAAADFAERGKPTAARFHCDPTAHYPVDRQGRGHARPDLKKAKYEVRSWPDGPLRMHPRLKVLTVRLP